jgi:hypothetical protein
VILCESVSLYLNNFSPWKIITTQKKGANRVALSRLREEKRKRPRAKGKHGVEPCGWDLRCTFHPRANYELRCGRYLLFLLFSSLSLSLSLSLFCERGEPNLCFIQSEMFRVEALTNSVVIEFRKNVIYRANTVMFSSAAFLLTHFYLRQKVFLEFQQCKCPFLLFSGIRVL